MENVNETAELHRYTFLRLLTVITNLNAIDSIDWDILAVILVILIQAFPLGEKAGGAGPGRFDFIAEILLRPRRQ